MLLSIPFWVAIGLQLGMRRRIHYLLPVLMLAVFCGIICGSFWHWGLIVPLLISLLWITWPSQESDITLVETCGRAAMMYVIGVQIVWSAYAVEFDHFNAYSPDYAAAQFLKPYVESGSTIAVTYLDDSPIHIAGATGILPYFEHNIYINQPFPFYWCSTKNQSDSLFNKLLPSHPRVILAETQQTRPPGLVSLQEPRVEWLLKSGYKLTNVFCGTLPFRMEKGLTNCHYIFQYHGNAP